MILATVLAMMPVLALPAHIDDVAKFIIEHGVIVAFEKECPADDGWVELEGSAGMFLMGADDEYPAGKPGVTPTHSHGVKEQRNRNFVWVEDDEDDRAVSASDHSHDIDPASTRPPFIAVKFCKLEK